MPPSSSPCDPPATAVLRLRLMDAILRADTPLLAFLVDVLQETGLLELSEEPPALPGPRQKGTVHLFRRSRTDQP
jgi:hypothetical protein